MKEISAVSGNNDNLQSGFEAQFLYAAKNGYIERAERLLLDGAYDPSADNNSVLIWSAENGHENVVRVLLKDKRVNPTANDDFALQVASFNGHAMVVKVLLMDGRCAPENMNSIALWGASQNGHLDCVKLLLEDGRVDINAKFENLTALDVSILNHHDQVASFLLEATKSYTLTNQYDKQLKKNYSTTLNQKILELKDKSALNGLDDCTNSIKLKNKSALNDLDDCTNSIKLKDKSALNDLDHDHTEQEKKMEKERQTQTILPPDTDKAKIEQNSNEILQANEKDQKQLENIYEKELTLSPIAEKQSSKRQSQISVHPLDKQDEQKKNSKTQIQMTNGPLENEKRFSLVNLRRLSKSVDQIQPKQSVIVDINQTLLKIVKIRKTIPLSEFSRRLIELRLKIDDLKIEINSETFNIALALLFEDPLEKGKHGERGTVYSFTKELLYFGNGLENARLSTRIFKLYSRRFMWLKRKLRSLVGSREKYNPLPLLSNYPKL